MSSFADRRPEDPDQWMGTGCPEHPCCGGHRAIPSNEAFTMNPRFADPRADMAKKDTYLVKLRRGIDETTENQLADAGIKIGDLKRIDVPTLVENYGIHLGDRRWCHRDHPERSWKSWSRAVPDEGPCR